MIMNEYQKLTLEGLKKGLVNPEDTFPLAGGFTLASDDIEPEDCVLVMGLNPAGDEEDSKREEEGKLYLYALDEDISKKIKGYNEWEKKERKHAMNNGYFRPILRVVNETLGEKGRWVWSKKNWKSIEKQIKNDKFLSRYSDEIKEQYVREQERPITIYTGELFYVHHTDSKAIKLKKKQGEWDPLAYAKKMMQMHVDDLKKQKKNIRYIFINNKNKFSNIFKDIKDDHFILGDGTYVFFSNFLSNGCSEEYKKKLIKRIRELIGS